MDIYSQIKSSLSAYAMLPSTFAEAVSLTQQFALSVFDDAIATQQLYYHNHWHIHTVQTRVDRLFAAVAPTWLAILKQTLEVADLTRVKCLLDLCVTAHDMVQIFLHHDQPHTPRRRQSGVSELATVEQLFDYIDALNHRLAAAGQSQAQFSKSDLAILQSAILGTICTHSAVEQAIYQPDLYAAESLGDITVDCTRRILALADIGTFGMDGIEAYNQEGSLLFLEENLDIIPVLKSQTVEQLYSEQPVLAESFRKRLLQRARFQVSFAQSRLIRTPQELAGFSNVDVDTLLTTVFPYLNSETLTVLKATTPTAPETSLQQLLDFFRLDHYLENVTDYINTRRGEAFRQEVQA